ncbi:hypothetical protein Tco_0812494 [Tanacetum coccineum]
MFELPDDAIGIYHRMFDFSGVCIPFYSFLLALIKHYKVYFSQLGPLGLNKGDWFSFAKRCAPSLVCIDDNRSWMKHWKSGFSFIDRRAILDSMVWRHPSVAIDVPRPTAGSFSMDDEEPHLDVRPTLQRLPFYCTPSAAADAVIPDPTLEDLAIGLLVLRFLLRLKLLRSERPLLLVPLRAIDDDDDDACVEILLVTPIRSAAGKGIMADDVVAPSVGVSRPRPSSGPAPSFRDVSGDAINVDFFPFLPVLIMPLILKVDPTVCKTVVDQFPAPGEMVWVESLSNDQSTAKMNSRLKGYEEKVASLTGLELQVSTLKKQVSGLNNKLSSSDASFAKSKAKGKERKKKIKSLTKSLDNLHVWEGLVWKFLAFDEFSRVQGELLSLAASAGFERGLSMLQTKDEFVAVLKKMANFMPGAQDSFKWQKSIFEIVTSIGIRYVKAPNPSRQIRNEDLRTELEYFSEDYDEEFEMEPRPERTREVTPPLRTRSPRVRRQCERVVGFEEAPNKERSRIGRYIKGNGPSKVGAEENGRREMNLPPLLAAHLGRNEDGQPPRSSLTSVYGGRQSLINTEGNLPPNDGLKMPSHVGSYDGKGDPDNFLHLFEGAIHLQKWLMPVFTTSNKEKVRVLELSPLGIQITLKILLEYGRIVKKQFTTSNKEKVRVLELSPLARNLVEHLSTDLPSTYKGLMEKTYTWIEAREVANNGALNDRRDNFERSLRVDSKNPLVGFSGEYSWPLGDVPLEITIGEGLLTVTKTLNFVIVRSDSPHNLLLGRTAMQQMGIVVSTIHGAIKFHTPKGIGTLLLENSSQGPEKNAYKGYHQILIVEKDEEKTAFYTREGVFCYKRLPFGLKNAGETYQRLIDKETLERLRAINLKLDTKKCSFGVEEGRFLGRLITKQGIKADPLNVKAISDL